MSSSSSMEVIGRLPILDPGTNEFVGSLWFRRPRTIHIGDMWLSVLPPPKTVGWIGSKTPVQHVGQPIEIELTFWKDVEGFHRRAGVWNKHIERLSQWRSEKGDHNVRNRK